MRVPAEAHKWIRLQRGDCKGVDVAREYEDLMYKEYKRIRAYLPEPCQRVVDIGCGVGGLEVFLWADLRRPTFYLVDKTELSKGRGLYGYRETGAAYNDNEVTRGLLRANGVPDANMDFCEASERLEEIDGKIDLVVSLSSCGFHYPVGEYLDRVVQWLRPGGVVIFDIRNGTDGGTRMEKAFGAVERIWATGKAVRLRAVKA